MDTLLEQKRKGQAQFHIQIQDYLSDSLFTKTQDQLTSDVLTQIFTSANLNPNHITPSVNCKQVYNNGKINLQRLMQSIYDSGIHFNRKDFSKIFNNKKQLRVGDLFNTLKSYNLTGFELEEEIIKNFFENNQNQQKDNEKINHVNVNVNTNMIYKNKQDKTLSEQQDEFKSTIMSRLSSKVDPASRITQKFSIKKLDKIMRELGLNQLNKKDKEILVECFDQNNDHLIDREDINIMMDKIDERRKEKIQNKIKYRMSAVNAGDEIKGLEMQLEYESKLKKKASRNSNLANVKKQSNKQSNNQ